MDSTTLFVENCLGIEELESIVYTVYPNPAKESVHIKRENTGCFNVRLLSLLGETLVNKQNICSDLLVIDLKSISKGTYLIEVTDKESRQKEIFEVIVD